MKVIIILFLTIGTHAFANDGSEKSLNRIIENAQRENPNESLSHLLKSIDMVPIYEAGKTQRYRVINIKEGSTFQKLRLKKGDVLVSIKGEPVTNPKQALELFSTLKTGDSLELNKANDD